MKYTWDDIVPDNICDELIEHHGWDSPFAGWIKMNYGKFTFAKLVEMTGIYGSGWIQSEDKDVNELFSTSNNHRIRVNVAYAENIYPQTALHLSRDPIIDVRLAIATNESTPVDILYSMLLSTDFENPKQKYKIWITIASRDDITQDIRAILLQSKNIEILWTCLQKCEDFLVINNQHLLNMGSRYLRIMSQLVTYPISDRWLLTYAKKLSSFPESISVANIMLNIIEHTNASSSTLDYVVRTLGNRGMCKGYIVNILANKNISDSTIRYMLDSGTLEDEEERLYAKLLLRDTDLKTVIRYFDNWKYRPYAFRGYRNRKLTSMV